MELIDPAARITLAVSSVNDSFATEEVTCCPWMRQPPLESFSIHSTLVCVKMSAPFFAASGR